MDYSAGQVDGRAGQRGRRHDLRTLRQPVDDPDSDPSTRGDRNASRVNEWPVGLSDRRGRDRPFGNSDRFLEASKEATRGRAARKGGAQEMTASQAARHSIARGVLVLGVAALLAGAIWAWGKISPRSVIEVGGEKYVIQQVIEPEAEQL